VAEVKLTGVDDVLRLLQSLPAEVVSKRGGPVKAALRTGARVIQQQASLNLARAVNAFDPEGDPQSTGLLLKNLVVTRGKAPSSGNGERYLVRVRKKVYPNRKGEVTTTLKTAQLLEYGSSKQPAEPWIRPAFNAKALQAINVTVSTLRKNIDAIVRKLGRKGGLS
jgi:HK97 gp10 family phage protein